MMKKIILLIGIAVILLINGCSQEQKYCSFTIEQHYPTGEVLRGNNSFLITEHPKLIIYFTDGKQDNFIEEIVWRD